MNIIVTGAGSGIGREVVLHLLRNETHHVLAISRNSANLSSLKADADSSRLLTMSFDIVGGNYAEELLPFVQQNLGKIDVLINNAGQLINKPFTQTANADIIAMLQSNFVGHVQMIQAILSLMQGGGHIVNIGSMGGFQGSVKFAGLAAYSASKAALHTLTECLAVELADQQIKVNCLALGSAQTDMLAQAFPGYQAPVAASDMGCYIADFATTGHKFFNGKVIPVSVATP